MESPLPARDPGSVQRPLTILLVDDNRADCELLREALGEIPIAVDLVTYDDASAFVGQLPAQVELPDLVILDVGMPCLDGYAVLAEVRRAWPSVPVVVMSAAAFRDREARALAGGARAFLTKQQRFDDHLKVVRTALAYAGSAAG